MAISGATSQKYTLVAGDQNKHIFFEVTPLAKTGVITGLPVSSKSVQEMTFRLVDYTSGKYFYKNSIGTQVNTGVGGNANTLKPNVIPSKPINNATVIFDLGGALTADTNDKYAFKSGGTGINLTPGMISNNGRIITLTNVTIAPFSGDINGQYAVVLHLGTKTLTKLGIFEIKVTINGETKVMKCEVTN